MILICTQSLLACLPHTRISLARFLLPFQCFLLSVNFSHSSAFFFFSFAHKHITRCWKRSRLKIHKYILVKVNYILRGPLQSNKKRTVKFFFNFFSSSSSYILLFVSYVALYELFQRIVCISNNISNVWFFDLITFRLSTIIGRTLFLSYTLYTCNTQNTLRTPVDVINKCSVFDLAI